MVHVDTLRAPFAESTFRALADAGEQINQACAGIRETLNALAATIGPRRLSRGKRRFIRRVKAEAKRQGVEWESLRA